MDYISPSYIAILFICVIYITAYARAGITHPISLFFISFTVFIPAKYLFIKLTGLNYASSPEIVGAISITGAVEKAGNIFLFYLLVTTFMHQAFRVFKFPVLRISVDVKHSMVWVSIVFAILWLILFSLFESPEALLDGSKLRLFMETRGMGYVSIAYDLIALIALKQALDAKRMRLFLGLAIFHGVFTLSSGKTGQVVIFSEFTLLYLFMVRNVIPKKTLLILATTLPILALLHGIARVRGNLIDGIAFISEIFERNYEGLRILGSTFIERISELEEFSMLTDAILSQKIPIDPIWPINLPLQFIPRTFWPDKPYFFNPKMMSIFYPEILDANVNFAFLGLGEFIYAFGLLGVIPAAILTGYLLHSCDLYVKISRSNSNAFFAFFVTYYFYLISGFIGGWMVSIFLPTIFLNLLLLLVIGRVKFGSK